MTENVFVNRILNMKKIKYIGLDMDHTLIRYQSQHFEGLVYQYVVEHLVTKKGYPEQIRSLVFDFNAAIRGLVIDSRNGNIIKLSRYGAIRQSAHGTRQMSYSEQKQFYRSTYVDLNDPNYMVIDTAFSISFCVLYAQLVDMRDQYPTLFTDYGTIASDVLASVDRVHADGKLKQFIAENLEQFVIKDPRLVEDIQRYIRLGKLFFIVTNSDFDYTRILLDYAINPFLKEGKTWHDLFDYVITGANKPRFFYDKLRLLRVDPKTGFMSNHNGPITPGIYQGGNAIKFSDDLGLAGDEILYVGDHIYGDILRLKKDCNWRTALVVDELGGEIEGHLQSKSIESHIDDGMSKKLKLEEQYSALHMKRADEGTDQYNAELDQLEQQVMALDQQIASLLQQQSRYYNEAWGRVFRVGAEESFFAFQVERYACLYMEKLSDLLDHSPFTYFRAKRRTLPHDIVV